MSTRPLLLHASALNDDEYNAYTESLRDLAWTGNETEQSSHEDAYYENLQIGVRELRGWLRGRYSHVPPAHLDAILKFFSVTFSPNENLSGSQVFAVLRLAAHLQAGKEPDRSLSFVQAHPKSSSKQTHTGPVSDAKPNSNPFLSHAKHNPFTSAPTNKIAVEPSTLSQSHALTPSTVPPLPPRKPSSSRSRLPSQPLLPPPRHNSMLLPTVAKSVSPSRASSTAVNSTGPPPVPAKPTHVTSALMKQSLQASRAAQAIKKAEEQLEQERVMQVLKSSSVVSGGYSLAGASIERSSVVIGTNIRSTNPSTSMERGRLPHARADPQPSVSGSSYRSVPHSVASSDSVEERPPPLPRRRNTYHNHHQRQSPSPPASLSSLQQVALATPPSFPSASTHPPFSSTLNYTRSPETSPSRRPPPPTHPDRKPPPLPPQFPPTPDSPFTDTKATSETESSPTARVFRSRSLHHPSPHSLPPPIPPSVRKKKRPESMQVLSPAQSTFSDGPSRNNPFSRDPPLPSSPARPNVQPPRHPGHRRASASVSVPTSARSTPSTISEDSGDESYDRSAGPSARNSSRHASFGGNSLSRNGENLASSFHRTLNNLQPRLEARLDALQPKLEKAKFKAEASLNMKRGFVASDSGFGGLARKGSLGKRREEKEDLISDRGDDLVEDERRYDPPSVDESIDGDEREHSDNEGARRTWSKEVRNRWRTHERDEMKWPVKDLRPTSEGWKRMT